MDKKYASRKFIVTIYALTIIGIKVLALGGDYKWGGGIIGVIGAYMGVNYLQKKNTNLKDIINENIINKEED